MAVSPLPKGKEKFVAVQKMFNLIAPKYDFMNRLMTMGLDQPWRREGLKAVNVGPNDTLVDIACGTGDIAEMAQALGANTIGVDFAFEMLRGAKNRQIKAGFIQGDAGSLPLPDGCASVVSCGFALRNFVALAPAISEMGRILEAGGRLMILEVYEPDNRLLRFGHGFYFNKVVPLLGALLSDKDAYRYLPRSVEYLPGDREFFALFESAGFTQVKRRTLMFGAAQMITGVRQ